VFSLTTVNTSFALTDIFLWQWVGTSGFEGYNAIPYTWSSELVGGIPVYTVSAVPIPAAVWLLGSGVVGLVALKRRKRNG
jgi:hypothetical protein